MPRKDEWPKRAALNVARIAAVSILAIVVFQIASPLTEMVFTNRYDDRQAIRLHCTFLAFSFECRDLISNVTGEHFVLLTVELENQNVSVYSTIFNSSEILSVGLLKTESSNDLLVVSLATMRDHQEYVVTGKVGDFYEIGNRVTTPVLSVTEFHEPTVLEEFVWENAFLFASAAILSWVVVVSTIICAIWYFLVLGFELEQENPDSS